jgi:hypothetical protein
MTECVVSGLFISSAYSKLEKKSAPYVGIFKEKKKFESTSRG